MINDFTVEAWFYVPNTINTSTDVILWKDQAYALYVDFNTSAADEIYFDIWQDATHLYRLQTSANFSQGWHHIAGTFSNEVSPALDTYSLYLNGTRINTSTYDFPSGINNSGSMPQVGLNGGRIIMADGLRRSVYPIMSAMPAQRMPCRLLPSPWMDMPPPSGTSMMPGQALPSWMRVAMPMTSLGCTVQK